ncbi:hypothetical protein C1X05_15005 [Laceyella sacchari]|nr:hypothetical protein C1X05_15005 [Laceyella sacchari]
MRLRMVWLSVIVGLSWMLVGWTNPPAPADAEVPSKWQAAQGKALTVRLEPSKNKQEAVSDVVITYKPDVVLAYGRAKFHLPKGFSAVAGDLINGQPLSADYIQNGGQTVTLPFGVDIGAMRTFELRLVGKKLPSAGQYKFRAEYWGIGIGIYNTTEAVLELRN